MKLQHLERDSLRKTLERWSISDLEEYANAVASQRFNSCHENIKLRPLHLAVRQQRRYITVQLFSAKERWLISDKHLHHKIKAWPCLCLGNGTVNISYASKQYFFFHRIIVYSKHTSASDTNIGHGLSELCHGFHILHAMISKLSV